MTTRTPTDIDTARHDRDVLLAELRAAGATVTNPTKVACPFHDDKNPSMTTYQGEDGAWRAKCHAGSCGWHGDVFDVRAAAQNRDLGEVLREARGETVNASPPVPTYDSLDELLATVHGVTARYAYTSPTSQRADLIVVRIDRPDGSKRFLQGHQRPDGKFVMKAPRRPMPIYNRARVAAAKSVVVVEGEKDVHALHRVGITATTSPGGSGNAASSDWSPLAGKRVTIWRDNDESGEKYEADVVRLLDELDPPAIVSTVDVRLLELPPKGDVADFIDREDPEIIVDLLEDAIDGATGNTPSDRLRVRLEETISGQRDSIAWPWHQLGNLARALVPGTVTTLAGYPGASKSFFVLESLLFWQAAGVPVAAFMLEDAVDFHTHRGLAQLSANSRVTDPDWVKVNPDLARDALDAHRGRINQLGAAITTAPDQLATYDDVLQWLRRKLTAGVRIVVVDPISIIEPADKTWIADHKFLDAAKKLVVEHGASLILVTHPKKNASGRLTLDDVAGGAAWTRFAHCVLWIESLKVPRDCTILSPFGGRHVVECNRLIHVAKARNGPGQGQLIGMTFRSSDLRFDEHGIVVGDDQ